MSKFLDKFDGVAAAASYDGVEVVNTRHDGYRRAGFVFKKGRNEIPPVSYETLLALEADPFLNVTIIGEPYDEDFNDTAAVNTGNTNSQTDPIKTDVGGDQQNIDDQNTGATQQGENQDLQGAQQGAELLKVVMAALDCEDQAIYFNKDGSPRLAKWQEETGNKSLTKAEITKAIDDFRDAAQYPL